MRLKTYPAVITSLWIASCGQAPQSNDGELLSTVAGNHPTIGRLGLGYDDDTQHFLPAANLCVNGTINNNNGQARGELQFTMDETEDTIKGKLFAGGEISLDMPSWQIGGSGSYLKEHTSNALSSTYTYVFSAVGTHQVFDSPAGSALNPNLTAYGRAVLQRELNGDHGYFTKMCGSEYVSQIKMGATLFFTMKIEYLNQTQKEEIRAKIDASVKAINVNGQFEQLSEAAKRSTKITISANQMGGSPYGLTSVMDQNILQCNLENIRDCTTTVGLLINYAKGDFKDSLAAGNWAILNYETVPYQSMPYTLSEGGDVEILSILDNASIKDAMKRWQVQFAEAEQVVDRANYLLSFAALALTPAQQGDITSLRNIARDRRQGFYDLLRSCYDRLPECEFNIANDTESTIVALPPSYRASLNPNVLDQRCAYARKKALDKGAITQRQFDVYTRINFAPEYATARDSNSEIIGWGACETLASQL